MTLSPQQFEMFTPVDKDGEPHKELPTREAGDYAYWMNSANPGEGHSSIRRPLR